MAAFLDSDQCNGRVFVLAGAGLSTSAGIPDFRSPGTGLYANLAKLNLPYPEAVFDIHYFRDNPQPFYTLASSIAPGNFKPTPGHAFLVLLHQKRKLHTVFTQNIDTLERLAGVPPSKIVEAHGSFANAHCIDCQEEYDEGRSALDEHGKMRAHIGQAKVPTCEECGGLVKPDIVFFGESLPAEFMMAIPALRTEAALVIIMGTSLKVHPFAMLPNLVPRTGCVRLLFNLEPAGNIGAFVPRVPATPSSDHGASREKGANDNVSTHAGQPSRAEVGGGQTPLVQSTQESGETSNPDQKRSHPGSPVNLAKGSDDKQEEDALGSNSNVANEDEDHEEQPPPSAGQSEGEESEDYEDEEDSDDHVELPEGEEPPWLDDVVALGDCDASVRRLCDLLGWREDLERIVDAFHRTTPASEIHLSAQAHVATATTNSALSADSEAHGRAPSNTTSGAPVSIDDNTPGQGPRSLTKTPPASTRDIHQPRTEVQSELDPSGPEGRGASASLKIKAVVDEKGNTLTHTEKPISGVSGVSGAGDDDDGETRRIRGAAAAGVGHSERSGVGNAEADTDKLGSMNAEGWARGVGEIPLGVGSVAGEDRARMRLDSFNDAADGSGGGDEVRGDQLGDTPTKYASGEVATPSSVQGAMTTMEGKDMREHHPVDLTMEKIIKDMKDVL